MKLGVALYTLREECKNDFKKTLEVIAELGFDGVEFAGFHNMKSGELSDILKENNITAISSHTSIEELTDDLDEVIRYNKEIGNKGLICPWYCLKTENDIDKLAQKFDIIYKKLKEHNMEIYYHNHSEEFNKINGNYILDILLQKCKYLKLELDTFWAFIGDTDIDKYMDRHKSIMDLIHLKDGDKDTTKAIGEGIAPIHQIVRSAIKCDIKWIIIENDTPQIDGITDITKSIKKYREIIITL